MAYLSVPQNTEYVAGDNFGIILVAIFLAVLIGTFIFNKTKSAKVEVGEGGTAKEVAQNVITSLFSEERFKVLVQQCVEDSLNALVKGSTKEQFVESIKDNICDSLYNFVETEYPMYTVVCSRENIETLADAILDNFGFDEETIETSFQSQIEELNNKTED